MEVLIILGDGEIAEGHEARQGWERGTHPRGMGTLARAVLPNLELLRDGGPDWQMLRDLQNPFKW